MQAVLIAQTLHASREKLKARRFEARSCPPYLPVQPMQRTFYDCFLCASIGTAAP
ncbi:hypothetical protein LJR039_000291 [Pseudorhodoferax sp. LjRoot39]|uniref:hypothetical protein n=1 Tax=Pseudorhodoferax sp. LjRoot39 TaxID=3342328 RepID=UPI003ECD16B4